MSSEPQENELAPEATDLYFKVSSGLKRIIGRDLIVNDFVAIFELVKNSFDARATRVDLVFEENSLFVIDNGKGMTHADITDKWLFVAYSAKKDGSEEAKPVGDYRDHIQERKIFAGSKGVGRFSCDRLGNHLKLQTKYHRRRSSVEVIDVDWDLFEQDDKEEFIIVPVKHNIESLIALPSGVPQIEHGTVLEITGLRSDWNRKKLLDLKAALSKLINPFESQAGNFQIYIHAPHEKQEDRKYKKNTTEPTGEPTQDHYHLIVNGKVENFIFETLNLKTTRLDVFITEDNKSIESKLLDRGELIYHIREPNPYKLLESDFSCRLFYLNRAAKTTFTRRMGVHSVQFGSVFLFRNGFRVFPVGEEGDDTFGLDRRKQQGVRRYLGTRDIVGRIDVTGSEEDFKESTSRDQGLIKTPAYLELEDCFLKRCLLRLEKYVVGVTWEDPLDALVEDTSRLAGDKARARIIDIVSKLANAKGVTLLDYNKNLIGILNEKSEDFEESLKRLKNVAETTGDKSLIAQIIKAEARYSELKQAEAEARLKLEQERKAREEAEIKARTAESELKRTEEAYEEEKKRNLFLSSVSTVDHETIVNLHHQIGIYSADIHNIISNHIDKVLHGQRLDKDSLLTFMEQLSFRNQKILSISRFATKANFRLDSEEIKEDIASYVTQYIEKICVFYSGDGLDINVKSTAKGLIKQFKPIEVSMLIDNLLSNSRRAGATKVSFEISQQSPKIIEIQMTDDGRGLDAKIKEPKRIFEKGFTTTEGSGIGLYHVAYILDQMGGGIEVNPDYKDGAQFNIRISA